jgi:predicted MFS family arabinose efflux permease
MRQGDKRVIIWFIASGLFTTLFYLSFLVMAMRVSVKEVAATSYALIAATFALGTSAGGGALGPLEEMGGFTAIFGVAAIIVFIASLFTLGMRHESAGRLLMAGETRSVLTTD